MNRIYEYHPGYVEGFDKAIVDFETKEELLAIPFIARWAADKLFKEFVIEPYGEVYTISAKLSDGSSWVVGFLTEPL